MKMERRQPGTEIGDALDFFDSFSSSEEEQEMEEKGREKDSLTLLAAMMDRDKEKGDSKGLSRGSERKAGGEGSGGRGVKRKRPREDEDCGTGQESRETPGHDSVAEMKAELKEMQQEILRLRKQVAEGVQRTVHHVAPPPPVPAPTTTVLSAGGGRKRRQAHQPNPQVAASISRLSEGTHGQRVTSTSGVPSGPSGSGCDLPGERGVAAAIINQRKEDEEKNCLTEKYSGLRIKNPVVSSEQMRQRMQGRKMVRIPQLASRAKGGDIEGDWVTIGVVVDKLPPRDSAKGEKFSVWKLSDLSGQSAVVSLFLFGRVYQEHWKTAQGTVVALLNPSIMQEREGGGPASSSQGSHRNTLALTLDHPQKLMLMGVSLDFTTCKATTKSGKRCFNFAKASDGGYCDYHVQGAYRNTRAQRMEFQSGYGPNASSGKLREKLFRDSGTEVFYYAGQTFTSAAPSSKDGTRVSPREGRGRLFAPGAKETAAKVSQELQERREANSANSVRSGRGVVTQEGSQIFKQLLSTQSVGARMLTKHLQKEETVKKAVEKLPEKSASELLKEHKQQLKKERQPTKHRSPSTSANSNDFEGDDLFTPDCILSVDGKIANTKISKQKTQKEPLTENPENETNINRTEDMVSSSTKYPRARKDAATCKPVGKRTLKSSAVPGELVSASRKKNVTSLASTNHENCHSSSPRNTTSPTEGSCRSSKSDHHPHHSFNGDGDKTLKPLLLKAGNPGLRQKPTLRMLEQQDGAGHTPLSRPQLGRGFKPGSVVDLDSSSKPALAKLRAMAVIHRKGPLEPQDPNRGGRQGGLTPAQKEAIRMRVEENREHSSDSEEDCEAGGETTSVKKRKLDSIEVQRILNAKSSHDWAVKEDEWEREQEYFDRLEKKENIEEKLNSITELRVTVVQCKQCNYVAEYPGELCRKENHHLSRFKATKKWFECQDCRERCCTYNARYPSDACRKCGSKSFKQTSFHKERQGPKLPTEELSLRGVEEKFLNSLK